MNRKDVEEIIEIIMLAATHLDESAIVTPVGGYRYLTISFAFCAYYIFSDQ